MEVSNRKVQKEKFPPREIELKPSPIELKYVVLEPRETFP